MYTSYFAMRLPNAVSIALFPPRGWAGPRYPMLAPKVGTLQAYKAKLINEEQYTKQFIQQVLQTMDPRMVYDDLVDKYGVNCTLVCYEKPNEFCHRHIVARWLRENLNVEIEEYVPPALRI